MISSRYPFLLLCALTVILTSCSNDGIKKSNSNKVRVTIIYDGNSATYDQVDQSFRLQFGQATTFETILSSKNHSGSVLVHIQYGDSIAYPEPGFVAQDNRIMGNGISPYYAIQWDVPELNDRCYSVQENVDERWLQITSSEDGLVEGLFSSQLQSCEMNQEEPVTIEIEGEFTLDFSR